MKKQALSYLIIIAITAAAFVAIFFHHPIFESKASVMIAPFAAVILWTIPFAHSGAGAVKNQTKKRNFFIEAVDIPLSWRLIVLGLCFLWYLLIGSLMQ